MRAITVRQPWAWQIINQAKDVENRTRNIAGRYRGPLAIHAGLQPDKEALRDLPMHAPEWVTARRVFDYGVVLGVVDLVDVHMSNACFPMDQACCASEWAEAGRWHLVLANPRPIPLQKQFTVRGALGLWTPAAYVIERIIAAVVQPPTDDEIDAELALAILGYDSRDSYPEWSNASMREAYRAGWEDGRNA